MSKHFLPHAKLEEWALEDKADLKDGRLVVASEKATFTVTPAAHFTKVVSGNDDKKLVSKVKTQAQMNELGIEQMMDSAILGDVAYEVVPGYLAEVPPPPSVAKPVDKKVAAEADMLAAFLLDKL